MPQAHLLITLVAKIDTPENVDSIISAEITEYPKSERPYRKEKLHYIDLIGKFLIHGPCSERSNSLSGNRWKQVIKGIFQVLQEF
ncbi:unnamed protein product [Cylicostephanus goldi]|uniref:Uncharacterized protein n=1 Tax=Cylicostephanus goldi TaxID=71465 RepID=A0A3P7N1X3_CYLGO|nr:unnamed protein product [Cylicostephanus goldi]